MNSCPECLSSLQYNNTQLMLQDFTKQCRTGLLYYVIDTSAQHTWSFKIILDWRTYREERADTLRSRGCRLNSERSSAFLTSSEDHVNLYTHYTRRIGRPITFTGTLSLSIKSHLTGGMKNTYHCQIVLMPSCNILTTVSWGRAE